MCSYDEPKYIQLSKIFENKFCVPIYQRNYTWGKTEIEQLIDDISCAENYFIGNLVVCLNKEGFYEVVDGQQRLTTGYLLLHFLKINSEKLQGKLFFQARPKYNYTLNNLLSEERDDSKWSKEVEDAYIIIKKYFEIKKCKDDFLKKIESAKFLKVCVPADTDLNQYFEIMNTRGEQLEPHEIVKARLMSELKCAQDRNLFSKIWDACSDMERYIQVSFSFGDTKTREKVFGKDWSCFEPANFKELKDMLLLPSGDAEGVSLKEPIKDKIEEIPQSGDAEGVSLKEAIKNYSQLESEQKETEKNAADRFESIIKFPNFLLQTLYIFCKDNENAMSEALYDKNFISLFEKAFAHKGADDIKAFVFHLLRTKFIFDNYIIKREYVGNYIEDGKWKLQIGKKANSNNTITYSPPYSNDNDNDNDKIKVLQALLRITYTSPRTMEWLSKILSSDGYVDKNKMISLCEDYFRSKVGESLGTDIDAALNRGFGIERVVFTYIDYLLLKKEKEKEKGNYNFDVKFRNSIEHFCPRTPDKTGDYKPISNELLDSIGNLALITVSGNSKFSNLTPSQKAENYDAVIKQSPKLIQMGKKASNWDDNAAQEHYESIKKLILDSMQNNV